MDGASKPAAQQPASASDADRKRALLLQARRERLAWVLDEDYEAPEPLADALLQRDSVPNNDESALPSGWRRGRVSELLSLSGGGSTAAQGLLLPSAAEYVAFLNRLAGETDVETVRYPASALLPKLPGDAELLHGDGEEDGEEEEATMPPLPPLPTRGGGEGASLLTYEAFVARLGHPLSSEVVGALQRFVGAFVRRQRQRAQAQQQELGEQGNGMDLLDLDGGIEALAAGMHAFIDGLRAEMRKSPAWRALVAEEGQDPLLLPPATEAGVVVGQWEEVRDHLETFLVTKLHRYLFTPRERAVLAAQDAALSGRLRALAFLGPEHLDVRSLLGPTTHHNHGHGHEHPPPPISKTLAPAITAFSRAIQQRAPRAVLDHLLAASRLVTRALVAARRDGTLPGADEVLPALILVIKESNPPGLRSALEVVGRFRHPRKLQVSEAAYVFTNVASAVHFLESADAAQLNMTPDDLERSLAACRLNNAPALQHQPPTTPHVDLTAAPTPRASSLSFSASSVPGSSSGATNAGDLLSTTRILEAVEGQTAAAAPALAPPARLVSIQEIRRQRLMAKAAGPSPPPPAHKPAPPPPASRITELAARVHHAAFTRTTARPPPVSPSEVLAGCRFLQAAPEELRLAEVGALLEEHRALAALAADLARLLGVR